VAAAILRPATLVFLSAQRRFLSFRHHRQAVTRNTEADQIVFDSGCATGTQREVVLSASTGVAVAFDGDLSARPALHPIGIALKDRTGIISNRRLVEVEVDFAERHFGIQLRQ
jgi:hypothetical protein